MHLYHDEDASLALLEGRRITVIGYGNQGRAQALNLRDSGLEVTVGNREDPYAQRARDDGLPLYPIGQAAALADVIMMLVPDEVAPSVYNAEILPHLGDGNATRSGAVQALVFATGYNVAFGFISPPRGVDVVLVAPRMIGAGVRDLYLADRGFASFIGVFQNHSGQAREIALALAKGIGSTRMGVAQVTFQQEAELDLFTEQCFGPAFGHVLTTAVDLLLEEGYPPEAVLLELYMSGEFAYTLGKIAELGTVEQTTLHSPTSQYGSMSRGMRFILPELRTRMRQGLDEIRSGQFAQEWAAEQEAGKPTLKTLRQAARSLPLHALELELLQELRAGAGTVLVGPPGMAADRASLPGSESGEPASDSAGGPEAVDLVGLVRDGVRRFAERFTRKQQADAEGGPLTSAQFELVLDRFLHLAATDPALKAYSHDKVVSAHYILRDAGLEFAMHFAEGQVSAAWGPPEEPAQVRLETTPDVVDGMLTGRINAMRAIMTGKLSFSGDTRLAIDIQQIQEDLNRVYSKARQEALGSGSERVVR